MNKTNPVDYWYQKYQSLKRASSRLVEAVLFDWEDIVDVAREVASELDSNK